MGVVRYVASRRSAKLRPFPFMNTQLRHLTAERNLENTFRRITLEAPALRLIEPPDRSPPKRLVEMHE